MYDFLLDLDEYFCLNYANYDKLCVLPGYEMPTMQRSEVREDGRTYAYTLPMETMALSNQANKKELLAALKSRMTDTTFSFSFSTLGIFSRIKNCFSKYAPYKTLNKYLGKYGISKQTALEGLSVSEEVWNGICKGKFLPTKNLLYSLGLTAQFSYDDLKNLFLLCGYEIDMSVVKDVVMSYLFGQKVYNRGMIDAALQEYKLSNLFMKQEK